MDNLKRRYALFKARIKVNRIRSYLHKKDTIFDIGTGNGAVAYLLQQEGFSIITSDIKDQSIFKEVVPIITSGDSNPLPDNHFDNVLLLTMLHHTCDPLAVLDEAIRISRNKIIIIEDVYRNKLQQYFTFLIDSIVNLEFKGHPHTNKTEKEWEQIFDQKDLKLIQKKSRPFLICFRQVLYVLEIKKG